MAGNTKPAWVSDALTVAEQQIRSFAQVRQCIQHRRQFPKRQQTRNIRKFSRAAGDSGFHQFQFGKTQYGNGRTGHSSRRFKSHIDSRYPSHCAHLIDQEQMRPQVALDRHGRRRGQVP